MRAAVVQMTSGRSAEQNFEDAAALLREARGKSAELVVLPENFGFLGADDAERLRASEGWQSGTMEEFLAREVKDRSVWLPATTRFTCSTPARVLA